MMLRLFDRLAGKSQNLMAFAVIVVTMGCTVVSWLITEHLAPIVGLEQSWLGAINGLILWLMVIVGILGICRIFGGFITNSNKEN